MLRLKEEYDYLIVDTDEWLQDRAEEVTALSEAAQEWQQADTSPYPQRMLDWVKETFPTATGIYGDGGPFDGCAYNEENFLSDDFVYTYFTVPFALTDDNDYDKYSGETYMVTQPGCMTTGQPTVWRALDSHDETSLLDWASGYANCPGTNDTCDWIIQSAGYHIWQNGGVYHPVRFADLEQQLDEDGEPTNVRLCPVCKGPMEFWAN